MQGESGTSSQLLVNGVHFAKLMGKAATVCVPSGMPRRIVVACRAGAVGNVRAVWLSTTGAEPCRETLDRSTFLPTVLSLRSPPYPALSASHPMPLPQPQPLHPPGRPWPCCSNRLRRFPTAKLSVPSRAVTPVFLFACRHQRFCVSVTPHTFSHVLRVPPSPSLRPPWPTTGRSRTCRLSWSRTEAASWWVLVGLPPGCRCIKLSSTGARAVSCPPASSRVQCQAPPTLHTHNPAASKLINRTVAPVGARYGWAMYCGPKDADAV